MLAIQAGGRSAEKIQQEGQDGHVSDPLSVMVRIMMLPGEIISTPLQGRLQVGTDRKDRSTDSSGCLELSTETGMKIAVQRQQTEILFMWLREQYVQNKTANECQWCQYSPLYNTVSYTVHLPWKYKAFRQCVQTCASSVSRQGRRRQIFQGPFTRKSCILCL